MVLGLSICTSPKQKIVSDAVVSGNTALVGQACCGVLNGSPVNKNIQQRYNGIKNYKNKHRRGIVIRHNPAF